jgi:membrane-bound serine protease (ClpP class)
VADVLVSTIQDESKLQELTNLQTGTGKVWSIRFFKRSFCNFDKNNKRMRSSAFFFYLTLFFTSSLFAQEKVLWMKIEGEIDPRSTRYVTLALEKAKEIKANAILAEINTYGGAVDDADKIRTALLESSVPVYAFVNKNAASAGALISIACDSIYMAPGANIGAATVVVGGTGEAAPDKYQSYMRSMMRSTAEVNKRNPKIAEGMVDQDIELDTAIKKPGRVITFTTQEAIRFGFCDGQKETAEEVLKATGKSNAQVEKFELDWSEKTIAYFLNPALSGILILLILGGIYYELQAPGLGFPSVVSIVAALLYFTPYYLNGLAANWEILLFLVGISLLAVEIFVIPGFGVVGISGLALMLLSLFLVMVNNDFFDFTFVPDKTIFQAGVVSVVALTGLIFLIFWGLSHLSTSKRMAKISLQTTLDSGSGYTTAGLSSHLIGATGVVVTELRPIGKIEIEGEMYSAISRGAFLTKGTFVQVVAIEINTVVVKEKLG